jgi:hypothetical protein
MLRGTYQRSSSNNISHIIVETSIATQVKSSGIRGLKPVENYDEQEMILVRHKNVRML